MKCDKDVVNLMHGYLDDDLTKEDETKLRNHLEDCEACQKHFHELKRSITLLKSVEQVKAPENFTKQVMQNLPTEKKHKKYVRWFKMHPVVTAAAIFFVLMFSGLFTAWEQDSQLTVSKQEDIIIKGDTVIVPEGVTVEGDLVVKNGNLKIEGTVEGDVTLINGKLLKKEESMNGDVLLASAGDINGEFKQVNQIFDWILYHLNNFFKSIFSLGE
ncbi:anti-sigma factor [Ornithinibacillus sp. L9]|uniref:Anti-sigma-W factor RsiW n=1 Tax=Ornithinibacillus caprae TaxID=2678566 RepID=A0A6N8FIN2_9BACI|nr:zf-HC2 domain-containing protein [Ornithinibacillus caprae]MUK89325.1 anti-sigma factor [Ornithinibacillus caprae]